MDCIRRNWRALLIASLLSAATLATFWPVLHSGFIKLDDGVDVVNNPHVRTGLSWSNIAWAFRTDYQSSWYPLNWISHMLDVQLFGLNPGAHHLVNLLLHLANTLLLFLLLHRLTGAPWRSGLVAALFALHPLHVESVAWIAERKDVLSTFFFFLTLLAYVRAREGSKVESRGQDSIPRPFPALNPQPSTPLYSLAPLFFALGLMTKSMLVTLPLILLLFEMQRPNRLKLSNLTTLIPFFALALASSIITLIAASNGATGYLHLSLGARLANAAASYLKYLGKMFWPVDLAVFYPLVPFSRQWPAWEILAAAAALFAISWLAWLRRKRAPWFFVGWFWYLLTLLPVIGIIQIGGHGLADRYTYIPAIGIFICIAWAFPIRRGVPSAPAPVGRVVPNAPRPETTHTPAPIPSQGSHPLPRRAEDTAPYPASTLTHHASRITPHASRITHHSLALCLLALVACAFVSRHQIAYWRTNSALFEHALDVTCDNAVAFYNIGRTAEEQGNPRVAMSLFRAALAADPSYALAATDLGLLLEQSGHADAALALYRRAVLAAPGAAQIQNHLATMLWSRGLPDEAIAHYWTAVRAQPSDADIHYNLGVCLAGQGQWNEAVGQFNAVVRLRPNDTEALACLGEALVQQGHPALAEARFRQAVSFCPTNATAHLHLARLAAQRGDLDEALAQFRETNRLQPDSPETLNGLAFLLATHPRAELRNGPEAVRLAERACSLAGTNQPRFWATLDTAYAEVGRFEDAIRTAQKARDLALAAGQKGMADAAAARIELYGKRQPFRQ